MSVDQLAFSFCFLWAAQPAKELIPSWNVALIWRLIPNVGSLGCRSSGGVVSRVPGPDHDVHTYLMCRRVNQWCTSDIILWINLCETLAGFVGIGIGKQVDGWQEKCRMTARRVDCRMDARYCLSPTWSISLSGSVGATLGVCAEENSAEA